MPTETPSAPAGAPHEPAPDVEAPTADPTADEPQVDAEDVEEHQDDADDTAARKARREAAGLRTRLRDVEAERDALRARVDVIDTATATVVQAAEAAGLASGTDLLLAGVSLADLRDESGAIDDAAVRAAAALVLDERPHWRRPVGNYGQGSNYADGYEPAKESPSWGRLFGSHR